MDDQRRHPKGADQVGPDADQRPTTGAPRWVIAVAIVIAIALLGVIVFLHLSGAIGPGVHQGG